MVLNTSRFGKVSFNEEDRIQFADGLLGFKNYTQFILLDDPSDEVFAWLQSCEDGLIAFPILEPELFMDKEYEVVLSKAELQALEVQETAECRFFCIITIPDDPTQMTANLKAPLAINVAKRLGRQCILQSRKYEIKTPIFSKLQQRVVQNPNFSFKKADLTESVTVQVPTNTDQSKGIDL